MGQVSLVIEQDSSLGQDRLASRKNYCLKANLTGVNGIRNTIGKGSGRNALALASSSALQWSGVDIEIIEILPDDFGVNRNAGKRSRKEHL